MDSRKLKITFIHPDLGIGGAERLVLDVAIALAKQGHKVSFVTNHCSKSHAFEEIKNDEFPVKVIGDWLPRSFGGRFQAFCAYMRMIYLALVYVFFTDKNDDDVFFVDQIPVSIPFLKWTKKKVIYYCHHPDLLASPKGGRLKKLYRYPIDWIEYNCTGEADILLVNSEYTASVFRETFPKILKPIKVLYPTIASSFIETVSKIKNPKGISEIVPDCKSDDIVFLSINRFHPAKKLELAVEALDVLRQRLAAKTFNKIHLIIAGGYDPQSATNAIYYEMLTHLVAQKNLQDNVTFLKSPTDRLKADLLLACDCLIYTPINEHFGIVPLEAMACSKPVIACNSGGPRETVENGLNGFLCDCTAEGMAECIERLIDRDFAKRLGENGRKRLEKKFSWNIFALAVKEVVQSNC